MILSLVIGDGCLHYRKRTRKSGIVKIYGALTIDHGIKQSDYIKWKAELLESILGRKVNVRVGHNGNSIQLSVCMKRFRSWRKFCYPNEKKDISKILPFINNPEFALAVWLMDDGYCEPSFSKLASGKKKLYGARFRIFTCSETLKTHDYIVDWFKEKFDVNLKILFQKSTKRNKSYPFLKFNQADTLKVWPKIREFILQFKSMQYKFRHVEAIYQKRMSQRVPSEN